MGNEEEGGKGIQNKSSQRIIGLGGQGYDGIKATAIEMRGAAFGYCPPSAEGNHLKVETGVRHRGVEQLGMNSSGAYPAD